MDDYFDLGHYSRPITTKFPQAQIWFDRGLNWVYGFNHEEAVICFRKAAELDPECAMAYWGIAFASGPFYNRPWDMFSAHEAEEAIAVCHAAVVKARACAARTTPVEQELIGSIAVKYSKGHTVGAEDDLAGETPMRMRCARFTRTPRTTRMFRRCAPRR